MTGKYRESWRVFQATNRSLPKKWTAIAERGSQVRKMDCMFDVGTNSKMSDAFDINKAEKLMPLGKQSKCPCSGYICKP